MKYQKIKQEFSIKLMEWTLDGFNEEALNDIWDWFSSTLDTELLRERDIVLDYVEDRLPRCSGCSDPKSEGTHSEMTLQHFREIYLQSLKQK